MATNQPTVLYLSHGGGPLPLLGDAGHAELVACLKKFPTLIKKPSAILVVSAHWEADLASLTAAENPELIYDYYGFPPESYTIQYPAAGAPALAQELCTLLNNSGIPAREDPQRGYDHGLYIPLKLMYPETDIPCVQLSLVSGLDPETHIRIGNAVAGSNFENLLIIGSGFSFHNMCEFFHASTPQTRQQNEEFEAWLIETCSSSQLCETEREARLIDWEAAPSARYCHPREEHLLPLQVCYGVARRPCDQVFEMEILGKKASAYLWE